MQRLHVAVVESHTQNMPNRKHLLQLTLIGSQNRILSLRVHVTCYVRKSMFTTFGSWAGPFPAHVGNGKHHHSLLAVATEPGTTYHSLYLAGSYSPFEMLPAKQHYTIFWRQVSQGIKFTGLPLRSPRPLCIAQQAGTILRSSFTLHIRSVRFSTGPIYPRAAVATTIQWRSMERSGMGTAR